MTVGIASLRLHVPRLKDQGHFLIQPRWVGQVPVWEAFRVA